MHLRKMLTTVGAITAASVLVLAPTAAHATDPGNIAWITVNGSIANVAHDIDGPMKEAHADFADNSNDCSSGDAAGVVHGGTSGIPTNTPPNDASFTFNTLHLSCESFIPFTTISLDLVCDIDVVMDYPQTVSSARTDVVTGTAYFTDRTSGVNCARVTVNPLGCTIDVGGSVGVTFDENAKPDGLTAGWTQELTLDGTGAFMTDGTGLCGAIPDNTPIDDLHAVFNFEADGGNMLDDDPNPGDTLGGINFEPDPLAVD